MARLTIEDCLNHVDNRYDLVILAARRARQITFGADPMVEEDRDKPTVLALREIAEALVTPENIEKIGKPNPVDDLAEETEESGELSFQIPQ